jgi:uncharacterized protein YbjT (DUF2867 family)
VAADALLPDTQEPALRGIDTAYYLVHSMTAGGDFARRDLEAADNFARAAASAGVTRIVYLGGLVPPKADSEHLLSRRDTGEHLRAGRVPVTEVRAGIVVGPGSAAFEVMRDLVNNLPVMLTPRWVRSKSAPIALDNLLEYLLRVAEMETTAGEIYDAGGPETLSYSGMMRVLGEVIGRKPLIIPVPVLSPGVSSYWLSLTTAVPANFARALIGGLKHDIPATDFRLRELVPQRLLTFREAVVAALEIERRSAVVARWTEGAFVFRNYRSDYAFYAKKASGSASSGAPVSAAWAQVTAIGGKNRYYFANFLWTVREFVDWVLRGPGLNRGRRHPSELRLGDAVDSWRVVAIDPPRRLTLLFGMKGPGAGVMEFEIAPQGEGRTLVTVSAFWHPAGVWGLLYWYAMAPAHLFIFRGMARAIARRAEQAEARAGTVAPGTD